MTCRAAQARTARRTRWKLRGASGRDTRAEVTWSQPASKCSQEGQPPHAKGDTGQMHEAQDGQRGCTLGVPQAKMLFQVADRQLDRESGPIDRGLLFDSRS